MMGGGPGLLPTSQSIDVGLLSRLFADTTNSYKHLFFDALLCVFRDSGFSRRNISIRELAVGMVAKAWHPIRTFHLSLGPRDQVAAIIDRISEAMDTFIPTHRIQSLVSTTLADHRPITQYVQYRLLAPFFAERLRGVPDQYRNAAIMELAASNFDAVRPLYRLPDEATIELHPAWAEYFASNLPIVAGWAELHWVGYLQSRNPTVPGITEKAGAPERRAPLKAQTRYWKTALINLGEEPKCIYSGRPLDLDSMELDHFLPWTFVCHDALWNLVPVVPDANRSKGNCLPHPDYMDAFVRIQHQALVAARGALTVREWDKVSSAFIGDLRIVETDILDHDALGQAYGLTVRPQLDIARSIGFVPDWRCPQDLALLK
jgi:Uncharacterized protein conserved in bacteria